MGISMWNTTLFQSVVVNALTINTLLFDLDGTLLDVDLDIFLKYYIQAVAARVAPFVDPKAFIPQLLASTKAMVEDVNPQRTNQDVFLDHFFSHVHCPREVLMPVFDDFYARDYPRLRIHTRPNPASRAALLAAQSRGYGLVVATNPLFPLVAIRERLAWAGVDDFPYLLVTCYEDMHFCKPNLEYYEEICRMIGRRPDECLMVGNDVEEDLVASRLGIKTYLVTDRLINRRGIEPRADFSGTMADLADFLARDGLP